MSKECLLVPVPACPGGDKIARPFHLADTDNFAAYFARTHIGSEGGGGSRINLSNPN